MESTPHSPWTWIVPTAAVAGTVGLIAVARRKRKQAADAATTRPRDPRSYWQQQPLAANERPAQVEALGRILASQAHTQSDQVRRAVAWMARNRSSWLRRPLAELGAPGGEWGPIADRRPFATDQPATAIERTLADAVLEAPQSRDPSKGATHGFHRGWQDQLARRGHVQHDSDAIHHIWTTHFDLEPTLELESWTFYRSSTRRSTK